MSVIVVVLIGLLIIEFPPLVLAHRLTVEEGGERGKGGREGGGRGGREGGGGRERGRGRGRERGRGEGRGRGRG